MLVHYRFCDKAFSASSIILLATVQEPPFVLVAVQEGALAQAAHSGDPPDLTMDRTQKKATIATIATMMISAMDIFISCRK